MIDDQIALFRKRMRMHLDFAGVSQDEFMAKRAKSTETDSAHRHGEPTVYNADAHSLSLAHKNRTCFHYCETPCKPFGIRFR
jgi:hypothetical protein